MLKTTQHLSMLMFKFIIQTGYFFVQNNINKLYFNQRTTKTSERKLTSALNALRVHKLTFISTPNGARSFLRTSQAFSRGNLSGCNCFFLPDVPEEPSAMGSRAKLRMLLRKWTNCSTTFSRTRELSAPLESCGVGRNTNDSGVDPFFYEMFTLFFLFLVISEYD